jgi:hypothetical protein
MGYRFTEFMIRRAKSKNAHAGSATTPTKNLAHFRQFPIVFRLFFLSGSLNFRTRPPHSPPFFTQFLLIRATALILDTIREWGTSFTLSMSWALAIRQL